MALGEQARLRRASGWTDELGCWACRERESLLERLGLGTGRLRGVTPSSRCQRDSLHRDGRASGDCSPRRVGVAPATPGRTKLPARAAGRPIRRRAVVADAVIAASPPAIRRRSTPVVEILEEGGTAADAAVAASLASCVAETMMTGLSAAGTRSTGTRRVGGRATLDCFVTVPGLGAEPREPEVVRLEVPFGAELVHYAVGPATCAVPGLPAGLDAALAHARAAARGHGSSNRRWPSPATVPSCRPHTRRAWRCSSP